MMKQGPSFHFKDGKHIKPTSCNVIEDIYKVWWRRIISLSNWLHCAGYNTLPSNNYKAVMEHLATVGPLAVAVAVGPDWEDFFSGVLSCGYQVL